MKLLAIALLGCTHVMAPITAGDGHTYAVVRLVSVFDEMTDLGGLHYTLEIDEPGEHHRLVHGGGHGVMWLPDGTMNRPVRGNDYYVAEITLASETFASPEVGGIFIDDSPKYSGEAARFLHAHDLNDARCQLAHLAAVGMEPEPLAVIDAHPWRRETFAIARVTGPGTDAGFPIANVAGRVPEPAIPGPLREALPIGQLVVIASAAGKVTRWFAVPDLAMGRAWLAEIAKSGWPTAPFISAY
jgi:hypothetical protein